MNDHWSDRLNRAAAELGLGCRIKPDAVSRSAMEQIAAILEELAKRVDPGSGRSSPSSPHAPEDRNGSGSPIEAVEVYGDFGMLKVVPDRLALSRLEHQELANAIYGMGLWM